MDGRRYSTERSALGPQDDKVSPASTEENVEGRRALRHACIGCRVRKVRCDGQDPCGGCAQKGLTCDYAGRPRRLHMRCRRHQVLQSLRRKDSPGEPRVEVPQRTLEAVMTPTFVRKCVERLVEELSHITLILDREQLLAISAAAGTGAAASESAYALALVICAIAVQNDTELGERLCREAARRRDLFPMTTSRDLSSLTFFYLLSLANSRLDKHNIAWGILREAICRLQLARLDIEPTYAQMSTEEASQFRYLFWALFVTERAVAVLEGHPIILHASIKAPDKHYTAKCNRANYIGFFNLISLFENIDERFVLSWNGISVPWEPQDALLLQKRLETCIIEEEEMSPLQRANVLVTRSWLQVCLWQMSLQQGILSSDAEEPCLQFSFPMLIGRNVHQVMSSLDARSLELHNGNMSRKIFDIACAIVDIYGVAVLSKSGPIYEYFYAHIQSFSSVLSLRQTRPYHKLLLKKLEDLRKPSALEII